MSVSTSKIDRSVVPGSEEGEEGNEVFVDEEDESERSEDEGGFVVAPSPTTYRSRPHSIRQFRWIGGALVIVIIAAVLSYRTQFWVVNNTAVLAVQFDVEAGELETVVDHLDRCDEAVLSLQTVNKSCDQETRDASFLLVRRIGNWPNATSQLDTLLSHERLHRWGNIRRHWIIDNIIETDELIEILEQKGESYTVSQQRLEAFWEAPLVFTNDDSLHQEDSFQNTSARTLDEFVFNRIYANKQEVLLSKNRANYDWAAEAREIWSNATQSAKTCQPVHLVQWGAFCFVAHDMSKALLQLATQSQGQHKVSVRTTRPLTPEKVVVDQKLLLQVEKRALMSIAGFDRDRLVFYNQEVLEYERQQYQQELEDPTTNHSSTFGMVDYVVELADEAVSYGPWSVMDKPDCSIIPSCHYYYSRSPYYWPAPGAPGGAVKRDGYRVPGSSTHDSEAYKYDRTRWYDVYQNTTILALGWFYSGNKTYAEIGARNIRTWFLDPKTRMLPTLTYAHVKSWDKLPDDYYGSPYGHIDLVDVYFFMDAIRLIVQSGSLNAKEQTRLRSWFRELLDYLLHSKAGISGIFRGNNIGTYHDLFVMSVASFVGDMDALVTTAPWAVSRLWEQVQPGTGALPHELARPTCMHYQIYCLEGWSNVARVSRGIGYNLWAEKRDDVRPLCQAVEYVLARNGNCPGNIKEEDPRKLWSIWLQANPHCPGITDPANGTISTPYDFPSDLRSHFWTLGLDNPASRRR